jgi:hypothetical protein
MVAMMEKKWSWLPAMYIMKAIIAQFFTGEVATEKSACWRRASVAASVPSFRDDVVATSVYVVEEEV